MKRYTFKYVVGSFEGTHSVRATGLPAAEATLTHAISHSLKLIGIANVTRDDVDIIKRVSVDGYNNQDYDPDMDPGLTNPSYITDDDNQEKIHISELNGCIAEGIMNLGLFKWGNKGKWHMIEDDGRTVLCGANRKVKKAKQLMTSTMFPKTGKVCGKCKRKTRERIRRAQEIENTN